MTARTFARAAVAALTVMVLGLAGAAPAAASAPRVSGILDCNASADGCDLNLHSETPTISGNTLAGETLTAHAGDWGPAPLTLTYQWYRDGFGILDADEPTHRLTNADAGSMITVRVRATKPDYNTVAKMSAPTGPITGVVEPKRPQITGVPPSDHGAPEVGQTITAVSSGWDPAAVTLSYQWRRSGDPIPGAADSSYQVVPADAGHTLTVTVTGTAPNHIAAEATSYPTWPVPGGVFAAAPAPTISGTAAIGETLTVKPGAWSPAAEVFHYQWLADGTPLWMATGPTYTVPAGSGDSRISVRVTAHRRGFTPTTRTSAQTGKVFPASPTPTISGTRAVGSTLTAKPGTWLWTSTGAPSAPSFGYQWYRNGAAISGATSSAYRLSVWDAGKRVTVRVTGRKTGYATTARTSSPTGMITGGKFSVTPTPKLSGTAKAGSTLTATAGSWAPTPTLTYTWKRNGTAIPGATGRTYALTNSDAGKKVTVTVTARRTGFPTTSRTSAATVTITGGRFTGGAVAISGTKKVGATLTANRSGFSPTPSAYAYQWYRNGVKIAGATSSTYKLTGSDVGRTITVKVAAKRSGFDTRIITSAGYGPIAR
ncbi:hypothetical protein ACFFGH_28890 [Lysobacter korlensis]|uniref:Ig-like domain-containing protein n=1 Tax=Lysobacter korlensis TaxID=553636 RepID=A0ABV6RY19_9GAMM